ncbi:MAG: tetratricopeptide repeat protein [Bacteroidales bacterium]|nr:tetratricopeptide repeat protein [Bacteroidales bacterium]
MMKKTILAALLALLTLTAAAVPAPQSATTPDSSAYARTLRKALRFMDDGEWLNASAMFTIMLEQRPEEVSNYSNAIVTDAMLGDTLAVSRLLETSMEHNVSMDSIFTDVQRVSTRLGVSHLYERVLLGAGKQFSYLQRSLNQYLLRYYVFRNNGPEMVRYARIMLERMPASVPFRRILARGYMLQGKMDDAAAVWQDILRSDPDNLDTLLDLGNYYHALGRAADAEPYLRAAYRLHPTPYLASLLRP